MRKSMELEKVRPKFKVEWGTVFTTLGDLRVARARQSWGAQDIEPLPLVHKIVESIFDEAWRIPG